MEQEPVEKKICALMGLWVRFSREFEIVHHLIELTAVVAHQYVTETLAVPEPATPTTPRRKGGK